LLKPIITEEIAIEKILRGDGCDFDIDICSDQCKFYCIFIYTSARLHEFDIELLIYTLQKRLGLNG
jgi:hypothetical protein